MSNYHLPFDVITNTILPRLAVKSLIRFTSTCKTWKSIIQSPQFVAAHLNLNRSEPKRLCLALNLDVCHIVDSNTLTELTRFSFSPSAFLFYHCVDELVMIWIDRCPYPECLIWNPSIRRSKTIDLSPHRKIRDSKFDPYSECRHILYGLGYDELTHDHILVMVVYAMFDSDNGRLAADSAIEVNVYSLRTGTWRSVSSSPERQLIGFSGKDSVFLNGAIHWFASTVVTQSFFSPRYDYLEAILVFDIKDECFREVGLSESLREFPEEYLLQFKELEGSLAALLHEIDGDGSCLWVMTEYGVVESWTRKFRFCSEVFGRYHCRFISSGMLMCEEIESEEVYNVFRNMETGQLKCIEGCKDFYTVADFVESLVLFDI
ncbi:hypothetical protein Salat_0214700 [Sesamum alatum]|uniref:F-box domain-containing protein n=1 Tax=Sesamum alatum TaxID=300844 RepID=A0AAE2CY04_9LAMI|nr:hypothetical protein Salat_0214700 [Sesamum alatum]